MTADLMDTSDFDNQKNAVLEGLRYDYIVKVMEDGNSSNALPEHVMEHGLSDRMKIGERLVAF